MAATPAYFKRKTAELAAAELREYEALAYEIEMLGEVTRLLSVNRQAPQPLKNVLLESFGIHFRNLATFLWPPKKNRQDTDVYADHFAAGWAPAAARPDDLIARVGGEIAHLTTRRLPGQDHRKQWDPKACLEVLLPLLDAFVLKADQAALSPRVSAEVSALRKLVDQPTVKVALNEWINLTTSTTRPLSILSDL